MKMQLSIYSLKKVLFEGEATLLNCKTQMGEITVLDNHEPLIGVLKAGVMKVIEKAPAAADPRYAESSGKARASSRQGEHFFEIKSGFLEVKKGNKVRCLVD